MFYFNNKVSLWTYKIYRTSTTPIAKHTRLLKRPRLGNGLLDKYKQLEPLLEIMGPAAKATITTDNLNKAANFVKGLAHAALKPSTHAGLHQISSGFGKIRSGYGLSNTNAMTTFTKHYDKQ